jgi:hypothetical protein
LLSSHLTEIIFTPESTQDVEGIFEPLRIREANEEADRLPTAEEVLQAIKNLKYHRAPGPDGLNAELTNMDDNKLAHRICKVISFHLFAFIDPYWCVTFGYGTCQ